MAIDLNNGYADLLRLWREKKGKTLTLVAYGDPAEPDNIAIEDPESHSVVIDFDRPVGKEPMAEAPPSGHEALGGSTFIGFINYSDEESRTPEQAMLFDKDGEEFTVFACVDDDGEGYFHVMKGRIQGIAAANGLTCPI